jgi:decaheme cytochrome c component MtrC/MtrF-like protein
MKICFFNLVLILFPLASALGAVDYTKFSHATPKHKAVCNTCHKQPTKNWTKVSTFPDVADFPDHEACVSCHRAQFFKGAKPAICAVCHTKTSPRDDERYPFQTFIATYQFTTEFPHDRHQDVIALLRNATPPKFLAHAAPQNFNNCTICHAGSLISKSLSGPPIPYKSSPGDHGACFNCHWKSQEPVAANCNGCHKLAPAPYSQRTEPNRISRNFLHEGGGEKKQHVAECTTCHINITKSATLRGLKPDVPITACTECHNKEGLRQDLNAELTALDKDRGFVCVYCHADNVGKRDAPASHYLIAQRPPRKRTQ